MKKVNTIKIGRNIQKIRKSFGYTQEKLAEVADVSTRYISDVEQEKANPSYEVLIRICNHFNIGLDEVFSGYLKIKGNKPVEFSIAGFDTLKSEDKKTIEHLITYFNMK